MREVFLINVAIMFLHLNLFFLASFFGFFFFFLNSIQQFQLVVEWNKTNLVKINAYFDWFILHESQSNSIMVALCVTEVFNFFVSWEFSVLLKRDKKFFDHLYNDTLCPTTFFIVKILPPQQ